MNVRISLPLSLIHVLFYFLRGLFSLLPRRCYYHYYFYYYDDKEEEEEEEESVPVLLTVAVVAYWKVFLVRLLFLFVQSLFSLFPVIAQEPLVSSSSIFLNEDAFRYARGISEVASRVLVVCSWFYILQVA